MAGTTRTWQAVLLAVLVAAGALALGWRLSVVVGLGAAEVLLRHCRRRFGGLTGDVLGAVTEVATTASLVVLATR